jgi:hypothetical protein
MTISSTVQLRFEQGSSTCGGVYTEIAIQKIVHALLVCAHAAERSRR